MKHLGPHGTPAPEPSPFSEADESLLAELIDSLTDALRRGETPDVDAAARRQPQLADELRSLWATIWVAESLAFSDRPGSNDTEEFNADFGPDASSDQAFDFDGYQILKELGRGGMGVVYRARDQRRGRIVALKRLLRGTVSSARDVERFQVEATAASHLAHPHIVPVFQVGDHEGQPYFTMQYVEGTTLAKKLADGPMSELEAVRLLIPVCRAVHYAHERGVLHRDLKPSNILLDHDGHPYVSDFGLAKRIDLDDDHFLTPSDALLGTPGYMPPEQAREAHRRAPLGPTCDVYSLGAILYQTLTGRPPFQAGTPVETMMLALEQDPIAPRALNPRVSPDLQMVVLRCLQKQPELRYPSAAALADDLEAFLRDEPVSARIMSLRGLAGRLMSESHHAAVLENWGQLWIYHSIALLVFFGLTNVMHLAGVVDRRPYVLLFTVGLGAWAAFFWTLRRQGGPISFVERQLAHIWGSGIVAINLVFLVEWLLDLPVLSLAPMIAVTNGMLFMTKAGILSGFYYLQAAAVFLAVFPMAWYPRFAPIIFGSFAAACFFATGLKYKLRRQRRVRAN